MKRTQYYLFDKANYDGMKMLTAINWEEEFLNKSAGES